jgi:glucokinase
MSISFPFPILFGDVGGTNGRFALLRGPEEPLGPIIRLQTSAYASAELGLQAAIDQCDASPQSMILCGAGPLSGRSVTLTNAGWTFDGPQLTKHFRLKQGLLLNDLEGQALSLPSLESKDMLRLSPNSVMPSPQGVRLVIGVGTGLGVSALVPYQDQFIPLASEGGHCDLAFSPETDVSWMPFMERVKGHLTVETLLSGRGLARLHTARSKAHGFLETSHQQAQYIVERANQDSEEGRFCRATIEVYLQVMANQVGNFAVTFMATGGVMLVGGVTGHLLPFLHADEFYRNFVDRPPMTHLMSRMPLSCVTHDETVFIGMVSVALQPEKYGLLWSERLWCPF